MGSVIKACRLCASEYIDFLLSLGELVLTGVFPKTPDAPVSKGPLELVLCRECGLVQLNHSYKPNEMFGAHYGYRSSLNRFMVEHLKSKMEGLQRYIPVGPGDLVLDIGSNDGTALSFFPENSAVLCGMDPSAENLRKYYRQDINVVVDFFSTVRFRQEFGAEAKAKIITSIAMFYDLEQPLEFVRQIKEILHPHGVWHLEQSYLPLMLKANAYDTICHEHLEYYCLRQIKWMTDRVGLEILDVEQNSVNGGSFAITVGHNGSGLRRNDSAVLEMLTYEEQLGVSTYEPYKKFAQAVLKHREALVALLGDLRARGKSVLGYGASTKGNVILQFCGITPELLPAIAEVNESKFGCYTPGTWIPIIPEAQAKSMKPDYFLVFPWHFRENIIGREQEFLASGGKLLFPLPALEVFSG